MKKQKLSLSNLEVKSFVTSLNSSGIKTIQAGLKVVYDSSGSTGPATCTEPVEPVPPASHDCTYLPGCAIESTPPKCTYP